MNYLVAGFIVTLFAFFVAAIKRVGSERVLLEEFAKGRGGKRLPGYSSSATHQPIVEIPWLGHAVRITNKGTGGQQSDYGTSVQLFTSFQPKSEIQVTMVSKSWDGFPNSSLKKHSLSELGELSDHYSVRSSEEMTPLLRSLLEAITPAAIELSKTGKFAILLKGTIVEVFKEGECLTEASLRDTYERALPVFQAYLNVEDNQTNPTTQIEELSEIIPVSTLEPTIPKHADTEITVDKKKIALTGEVVSWPYLSSFRSFLATVVMGSFMVFVVSLLSVLFGQFGTVPFYVPLIFLAITLIALGLHARWRCLIEMDLDAKQVTYAIGNNKRVLCSINDISFIAVDGRRKEQTAGEWWWEYAVVIVTKDGSITPIIAPVMEELAQANNNAKALAAFLDLPLIEGQKRSMLKVENDYGRGRLNISFEEKQFEMYDAWPDRGSFSLSTPRKEHHRHRVIE